MLQDLNNRHFTHGPSRHGGALRELSHAMIKNPTEKNLPPDGKPEHHQDVIICSLSHDQHFLITLLKSER